MSSVNLTADGELIIQGDLNAHSVMSLWSNRDLSKVSALSINLKALERFDTAGLAWLLQLKGECKALEIDFSLLNTPSNVEALAEISGVKELMTAVK